MENRIKQYSKGFIINKEDLKWIIPIYYEDKIDFKLRASQAILGQYVLEIRQKT